MHKTSALCLAGVTVGAFIILISALSPDRSVGVIRRETDQQQQHQQQRQQSEPRQDWSAGDEEEEWQFRNPMEAEPGEIKCPARPPGGKSGKGKNQWPELVGKTADQAKAVLQKEAPEFQIQVIPPDHFATMDYRCERIRIWLNKQQLVSQPPMIG